MQSLMIRNLRASLLEALNQTCCFYEGLGDDHEGRVWRDEAWDAIKASEELLPGETPTPDARLRRAYDAFSSATSELTEAIHVKMSADLSYWASEGYPEGLTSFDEFNADVQVWAEAQKEILKDKEDTINAKS